MIFTWGLLWRWCSTPSGNEFGHTWRVGSRLNHTQNVWSFLGHQWGGIRGHGRQATLLSDSKHMSEVIICPVLSDSVCFIICTEPEKLGWHSAWVPTCPPCMYRDGSGVDCGEISPDLILDKRIHMALSNHDPFQRDLYLYTFFLLEFVTLPATSAMTPPHLSALSSISPSLSWPSMMPRLVMTLCYVSPSSKYLFYTTHATVYSYI